MYGLLTDGCLSMLSSLALYAAEESSTSIRVPLFVQLHQQIYTETKVENEGGGHKTALYVKLGRMDNQNLTL